MKKGKIRPYIVLFVVILALVCVARIATSRSDKPDTTFTVPSFSHSTTESNSNDVNSELEQVTVDSVIDGDTIKAKTKDGEVIKVRFIGVDTPESVHPNSSKNTEQGKVASEYTKGVLTKGKTVFLQYDTEKTDKYGRVLAYVWLDSDVNTASESDIREHMYNAELLRLGYAHPLAVKPNVANKDLFEKIAEEAKDGGAGFWSDAKELGW